MVSQKIRKAYTLFLLKRFNTVLFFLGLNFFSFSQAVIQHYEKDSINCYIKSDSIFHNKIIPNSFKSIIGIALTRYPELLNTHIVFKVKNKLTPLAARPKIWSVFLKPSKRKYIITISKKTINTFAPILLHNLSFNSQIGVMGHEISHISEYNSKRGWFFIGLLVKHFSKKQMDKFEYNTDKRCIEHGLGYQLLSWSAEVREKLKLTKWGGSQNPDAENERYMNPETIIKTMNTINSDKKQ